MLLTALGGCFQNGTAPIGSSKSKTAATGTSGGGAGETTSTTWVSDPSGSVAFTIGATAPSSEDPLGTFYVMQNSDGSGNNVGRVCLNVESPGISKCECVFTYTLNGTEGLFSTVPRGTQDNLLRCAYPLSAPNGPLPIGSGSTVSVQIGVKATGRLTNKVQLTLPNLSAITGANATNNFVAVKRYMCRQLATVPYFYDSDIYDPIQSEDPRVAMTFNFYSTNLGQTLTSYSQNVRDWECAVNPDDDRLPWANLTIHSHQMSMTKAIEASTVENPDLIFDGKRGAAPTSGATVTGVGKFGPSGKDRFGHSRRSLFFLAKKPYGDFTVAVNAQGAPTIATDANPETQILPPLGYAARTAADGSCPATVPIAGMSWAKLWLFSSKNFERNYVDGNAAMRNEPYLGLIGCNPGKRKRVGSEGFDPELFESCGTQPAEAGATVNNATHAKSLDDVALGATRLAARVVGTYRQRSGEAPGRMCVNAYPSHMRAAKFADYAGFPFSERDNSAGLYGLRPNALQTAAGSGWLPANNPSLLLFPGWVSYGQGSHAYSGPISSQIARPGTDTVFNLGTYLDSASTTPGVRYFSPYTDVWSTREIFDSNGVKSAREAMNFSSIHSCGNTNLSAFDSNFLTADAKPSAFARNVCISGVPYQSLSRAADGTPTPNAYLRTVDQGALRRNPASVDENPYTKANFKDFLFVTTPATSEVNVSQMLTFDPSRPFDRSAASAASPLAKYFPIRYLAKACEVDPAIWDDNRLADKAEEIANLDLSSFASETERNAYRNQLWDEFLALRAQCNLDWRVTYTLRQQDLSTGANILPLCVLQPTADAAYQGGQP